MGGRLGWGGGGCLSPAHAGEVRTGPKCHSKGSMFCPRGPASSSAHSNKGPLPQALCPIPPTMGQREVTATTPAIGAGSQGRTGQGSPLGQQRVSRLLG